MQAKLAGLSDRYEEVAALLSDPDVVSDRNQFTALSREHAELEPVMQSWARLQSQESELEDARALMADDDPYELLEDGEATGIVELPVEWIRDDAPYWAMDFARLPSVRSFRNSP